MRPILFSDSMIRAILARKKTQTRRLVKPQPSVSENGIEFAWATFLRNGDVHTWDRNGVGGENWASSWYPDENQFEAALKRTPYTNPTPYGLAGNLLYVREAWSRDHAAFYPHFPVVYRSDNYPARIDLSGGKATSGTGEPFPFRWKPSIHMPRHLSRITLKIERIWVERVQDISFADMLAEGVDPMCVDCNGIGGELIPCGPGDTVCEFCNGCGHTFKPWADLWDSINAMPKPVKRNGKVVEYRAYPFGMNELPTTWRGLPLRVCINPYVWAVEFSVVRVDCSRAMLESVTKGG